MAHLPPPERPVGDPTRGTTNPNRLRRVDRWLLGTQLARLRRCTRPLVVDLGYGETPTTTVELADRLLAEIPELEVIGVELDRERVEAAQPYARDGLAFLRGGFNLPIRRTRPCVIRAMNVLRQYDEPEAFRAWETLRSQLDAEGLLVEGTTDELGRRGSWVSIDAAGPRTLTFAARVEDLVLPSDLAERLPKALIHHNVPGQPIHAFLRDWDRSWQSTSSLLDSRQRWAESVEALGHAGWPVGRNPARWKLGECTVAWSAVAG